MASGIIGYLRRRLLLRLFSNSSYLIGRQIDPGVSWVRSLDGAYQLVLKSGNFGSVEFLEKAQEMYDGNH